MRSQFRTKPLLSAGHGRFGADISGIRLLKCWHAARTAETGTGAAIRYSMLKIRRSVEGDLVVFVLSGRIEKESLIQLEPLIKAERQHVALDLKEITLVRPEAVRFLAECEQRGASIKNCPAYVRYWISGVRRR
jgi:hypothetical protein